MTDEQIAALRKASAVLCGTGYHAEASTINSLLSASIADTAGAKPDGYALVPVDPTHLMIGAGARAVLAAWEENRNLNSLETVKIAYAAMLGAAPPAPSVADTVGAKPVADEQEREQFDKWWATTNCEAIDMEWTDEKCWFAWKARAAIAAPPAPSVADAAGASAIAALRSARHAIYTARNVNEAFDAVEALIVEAIAKESGND